MNMIRQFIFFVTIAPLVLLAGFEKTLPPKTTSKESLLLADKYPLDKGIEKDPSVLYTEHFKGSLDNILKRYTDVKNAAHMSLVTDTPTGQGHSIRITNNHGETDGGHLYGNFESGPSDTIYLRYYVKYPIVSKGYMSHISLRIGGNTPPSKWSIGRAGQCDIPNHFNLSYEPVTDDGTMDTYIYWPKMRSGGGKCYGNHLVTNSGHARTTRFDQWMCIEIMLLLNTPGKTNGALRVWQDGQEVGYWKTGFPLGEWQGGRFMHLNDGAPFEGFQWRDEANLDLKVNNIKFEFYDTKSKKGHHNFVQYSNVVIATKRIGPLKR